MAQTGDGSRVGLFIRIPDEFKDMYPDISYEDDSPRHITFLTGLSIKQREGLFLDCCHKALATMPTEVTAVIRGVDFFLNPKDLLTIYYSPVRFSADLKKARWDLHDLLTYHNFAVRDINPLVYHPHTTLAYENGLFAPFRGQDPPKIRFDFSEIEVWGLSRIHKIKLGSNS